MLYNTTTPTVSTGNKSALHAPVLLPMIVSWVVLAVISAILNTIVCVTIWTSKKLWTFTNCILASLSISDLLVALIFVPVYIAEHYINITVSGHFIAYILLASVFNLSAVTYERYIAITRPLEYRVIVTRRKVSSLLCFAWVFPLFISLIPLAWDADEKTVYHQVYLILVVVLFIMVPSCSVVWVYICFMRIVRQFNNRSHARASAGNRCGRYHAGKEEKVARVFGVIFAVFLLCWIPIIFLNFCVAFDWFYLITVQMTYISFYALLLNTIINPLIYSFYKKDFSVALTTNLQVCLGCLRPKRTTSKDGTSLRQVFFKSATPEVGRTV